jgi:hypothetical protein
MHTRIFRVFDGNLCAVEIDCIELRCLVGKASRVEIALSNC